MNIIQNYLKIDNSLNTTGLIEWCNISTYAPYLH